MITCTAREIKETDLHRRLNLQRSDELGELAMTFDQMIARLETGFERQRQFIAITSHELRTPLTIVNLEVNQALSPHITLEQCQQSLEVIR
jgi:signal transduction histidine kinase